MSLYIWICILLLFVTTYFTRMLPFLFCKGQIQNKYIKTVLAYLPYAVLTSMIFPEVFEQPTGLIPAIVGFLVAVILSYKNKSLIIVLAASAVSTFLMMLLNPYIMGFFGM